MASSHLIHVDFSLLLARYTAVWMGATASAIREKNLRFNLLLWVIGRAAAFVPDVFEHFAKTLADHDIRDWGFIIWTWYWCCFAGWLLARLARLNLASIREQHWAVGLNFWGTQQVLCSRLRRHPTTGDDLLGCFEETGSPARPSTVGRW